MGRVLRKLTIAAAAATIALGAACGGGAPALAAVTPGYDFAPIALPDVSYFDTDGGGFESLPSSTNGVTFSSVSLDGWRAPGTGVAASLLDASGRTIRSIDVEFLSKSRFSLGVHLADLCTGGYIIRVAVAGDPSRYEERAFAVPTNSTASCTMADPPSASTRPMVVLDSNSSAVFVDEKGSVDLPFWATQYDASGAGKRWDSSGHPAQTGTATLVLQATTTGATRRIDGVKLQAYRRPGLRLQPGSYHYWLETAAADGTVLRSNSRTVGVYRIAVQRTFSGRTVVRQHGHGTKPVVVHLAASLPAPPPGFLHTESVEADRLTACIRLFGDTGNSAQRCSSPRWTAAMTVRAHLTIDGRVRGVFRAGQYQVETDTGMADNQQIADAEVDDWTSIRAVTRD